MGDIDRLLDIDRENAEQTLRFLQDLDAELGDAVDAAQELFNSFLRAFSQGATHDDDQEVLERTLSGLGVEDESAVDKVLSDPGATESQLELASEAKGAIDRSWSRLIRGILLVQVQKHYLWGITDLLALRMTSMYRYMRLQAEGVALLRLIFDRPDLAWAWFDLSPVGPAGPRFFRNHRQAMQGYMRQDQLDDDYDVGSGVGQHIRPVGVVYGLTQSTFIERGRRVHELRLRFQETHLDETEGRRDFLLVLTRFLRTQQRVFSALVQCLPEADDRLLRDTRVPRFRGLVDRLFKKFADAYPDFSSNAREMAKKTET